MLATLARFVCAAYSPKGIYIKNISELRWHLFCKHMAESDKLPPTVAVLKQLVLGVLGEFGDKLALLRRILS